MGFHAGRKGVEATWPEKAGPALSHLAAAGVSCTEEEDVGAWCRHGFSLVHALFYSEEPALCQGAISRRNCREMAVDCRNSGWQPASFVLKMAS